MYKGKIVSLSGLKGGTSKSTNSIMLLNYLAIVKKQKVLLMDGDDDQSSGHSLYILDKIVSKITDPEGPPPPYEVIKSKSSEITNAIIDDQLTEEYDYIFIDLPGNMSQKGVLECNSIADYIFIPTNLSIKDRLSFIYYVHLIQTKILAEQEEKTKVFGFLSLVKKNTRKFEGFDAINFQNLKDEIDIDLIQENLNSFSTKEQTEIIDLLERVQIRPIEFLKTSIGHSVEFQNKISTNSILQITTKSTDFNQFAEEVYNIIK